MLVLLLRYCVECEQGFEESEVLAVLFGIEFAWLFSYKVFFFFLNNNSHKVYLVELKLSTKAGFGLWWKGKKMRVCVFFVSYGLQDP